MKFRFFNIGKANAEVQRLHNEVISRGGKSPYTEPILNVRNAQKAIDHLEATLAHLPKASKTVRTLKVDTTPAPQFIAATPRTQPAGESLESLIAGAEQVIVANKGRAFVDRVYAQAKIGADKSLEAKLTKLGVLHFELGKLEGETAPSPHTPPQNSKGAVDVKALANEVFGDDPFRSEAGAKRQLFYAHVDTMLPGVDFSDVAAKCTDRPKLRGTGKLYQTNAQKLAEAYLENTK